MGWAGIGAENLAREDLYWLSSIRGIERRGTPCDLSGVKGR